MTFWLSAGIILTLACITFILIKWPQVRCNGVTPVGHFTFIAILFTSGLDVGLIMFPLTEFATYGDIVTNPEYGFTNPLAIEFGFWAFYIWSFYFLTCFYFCVIEPKVQFFTIPLVQFINNLVIIGTCAFTAYLLLSNLPWYLPDLVSESAKQGVFYAVVLAVISIAVYSSTDIRYLRILSIGSTWLFFLLIAVFWIAVLLHEQSQSMELLQSFALLTGYFAHIEQFIMPINAYHEFYLFWWFAWSIMIGQFTARFVGGMRTYQLFLSMLIFPSLPIAAWFVILYYDHLLQLNVSSEYNWLMAVVGIVFVINSLDSLIRLYTDNLHLSPSRLGKLPYIFANILALGILTLLFTLDFLKIQWVGALVIGLMFSCLLFVICNKSGGLGSIGSPERTAKN
jgi:choline-glycine betaine transporter